MNATIGQRCRRGSALGVTLVLIALMAAAVGIMSTLSLQRSRKATRLAHKARSLAIAEAGARQVYSVLSTNFSARTNENYFTRTECGSGSYVPTVIPIGDHRAAVHSVGRFQDIETEVILDVGSQSTGGSTSAPPANVAYDYAILANQIDWSGGIEVGSQWVHSNTIFHNGGASDLNGNVSASSLISIIGSGRVNGNTRAPSYSKHAKGKIAGDIYEGAVPLVPIPDIDLTPYYNWALTHGEVYSGKHMINHTTSRPNGGILWVNGELKTLGAELYGCYIATESIDMDAGTNHHRLEGLPALMCRDGDIVIRSGTCTEGLIYTKVGNIDLAGSGQDAELHGSIVCAGEFRMRGGYEVYTYTNCAPYPPWESGGTPGDDVVYITAWQK